MYDIECDGKAMTRVSLPEGWEQTAGQTEYYRNFCIPVRISAEFKSDKADILYRTGEGFSFVGGADERMPQTLFIDYRPFEYCEEYLHNYALKLAELTGTKFTFVERRDVAFDEEAGLEKVRMHAEREIKRQGGNNKILLIKLYYEECCCIYRAGDKLVAIYTHIEAVKAGMNAKGIMGMLGGKVKLGDDEDLKNLNPFQTMDWEGDDTFIMVADEADFEGEYEKFIEMAGSVVKTDAYEEESEIHKKEIQGKLFMHGKSSKKMQQKKFNEWMKINKAEKEVSDKYLKDWFRERGIYEE